MADHGRELIVSVLPVPPGHRFWPQILELLETAPPASARAWAPEYTVWLVVDEKRIIAAISGRLLEGDEAEIVKIAGTRVREWLPEADAQVCEWARRNGAKKLTGYGRRGWLGLLPKLGWSVTGVDGGQISFEKVL